VDERFLTVLSAEGAEQVSALRASGDPEALSPTPLRTWLLNAGPSGLMPFRVLSIIQPTQQPRLQDAGIGRAHGKVLLNQFVIDFVALGCLQLETVGHLTAFDE
jgi:hypothetical protein